MNRYLTIFLSLFIISSYMNGAYAADIYTIVDIEASASGRDATTARKVAIAESESKAYEVLLKRITPEFMQHYFPEISPEEISALVQSYDIKNESVTPNHYKAIVSVTFSRPLVRRHMEDSGLSYIDKRSDNIVVIPIFYNEDNTISISNDNLWQMAWDEAKKKLFLLSLIVPDWQKLQSDIGIVTDLSAQDIKENQELISKIKETYKSSKILLVEAKIVNNEENHVLFTNNNLISENQEENQSFTETIQGNYEDKEKSEFLNNASLAIAQRIENEWKLQQGYEKFSATNLRVKIPIRDGIKEWRKVSELIKSLDFVTEFSIESLAVDQADVLLEFSMSYREFVKKLTEYKLYVEKVENNLLLYYSDELPEFIRQQNIYELGDSIKTSLP